MHLRVFAALLLAAAPVRVTWRDVPEALRKELSVPDRQFDAWVRSLETETDDRLRRGEQEHLIYYVLQARTFTNANPVEPALSRRDDELVQRRFRDFLAALERPTTDERLKYFQRSVTNRSLQTLNEAYEEARAFLNAKEVLHAPDAYETRGHSSDTQLASSYSVWNALQVVHVLRPEMKVRRVLIVGPGVDFASRTGFTGAVPPQSYQPYAVADALDGQAQIDCVDINPRALAAIPAKAQLQLPQEAGTEDFLRYQESLGRSLKSRQASMYVTAERMNIVTQRFSDRRYDLLVVTNVLLYFPHPQLALAVANMGAMLAPGGILIHNDTRVDTERMLRAAGMETIHARRVLIAQGKVAPLYDVISIVAKGK